MARAASRAKSTAVPREPGLTPLASAKCAPVSPRARAVRFIFRTKAGRLPASQVAR